MSFITDEHVKSLVVIIEELGLQSPYDAVDLAFYLYTGQAPEKGTEPPSNLAK